MKFLIWIGAIALGLYVLAIAAVYFGQRKLLYFPPNVYLSPSAMNVPMEEIKNKEGEIVSWWSPPQKETAKTVMVFHGNGSAVYSNHDIFRDLINAGHGVLSVGYPGYPGRRGNPNQEDIIEAARSQYDWVRAQGIQAENIVFYGSSLGTGVAAQLTQYAEPALLFVDAPFNSILDMAKRTVRFAPVSLLMKDQYRSDLALKGKSIPLIWTHGTRDIVVPLSQGEKLFDNYEGPKTAHIIQNGEHSNLWALGGRDITLKALETLE